jgi:membrane-associated phospholipid phosphatase
MKVKVFLVITAAIVAPLFPASGDETVKELHARREGAFFTQAGDVLQVALPASALGYSLIVKDMDGVKSWCLSVGSSVVLAYGLKYAVERPRPYQEPGERGRSFPSGHTAAAFAGAACWQRRYGWETGIPAYVLAAATGYSRIWSGNHYLSDVAAGAVIGTVFPYIFTKRREKVQIDIGAEPSGGGHASLTVKF